MANIYNASKPKYSGWEWFKYIATRVIFPPVLLWDAIKLGANRLIGERVGKIILPAQNQNFDHLAIDAGTALNHNSDDLNCEKHQVITHDKAQLDTIEVQHISQQTREPEYQKYIINFVGNGMCYEQIMDEMKEDARTLNANVVGFNLRGVGQSLGKATSKQDLVTDGIAQVQRLLDQGVSPQNITLKGHSLGAGVASMVAQHFHQIDQPVNIFNSRSFSSITNFIVGHIRLDRNQRGEALGQNESLRGKILGWLAKPFVALGIALAKWEINASSAFKDIPEAYKDYIVVRSQKKDRSNRIDDGVIPHYASMHKALSSERRDKKAALDKEIASLDKNPETIPLTKSNLAEVKEALVLAREQIKSDRKMETAESHDNGHNAAWDSLHNRSGKSAQLFFKEFVQRIEEDHAISGPKNNQSPG